MNKEQEIFDYIDLHCDTVLALQEAKEKGQELSLAENDLHIDLQKLKTGGCLLQVFALFTDQAKDPIPERQALKLYDIYRSMLDENKDAIAPVYTWSDLEANRKAGKISALLSLEEGDVVFEDHAMLRNWQRLGVRMIALCWNYPNSIGMPNLILSKDGNYKLPPVTNHLETEHGLTEFGRAYVRECEKLGILVDVSHMGDKGFWDIIKMSTKPVIASHSNSRKVCFSPRNLNDSMIKAIAKTGGVIGMNFCSNFLNEEAGNEMRIADLVRHILHIREVGGIDCIALGSDFDGIESDLEIKDASGMQKIAQALLEAGLRKEEVEKIFSKNMLRVLKAVLPATEH